MTLSELKSARATAGSRYAAALTELRESLVDLAALDAALSNRNVDANGGEQRTFNLRKLPESLADLEHAEFAPSLRVRLADQIAVARDGYIGGFAS
ncbi:hypothetical protein [Methylocystis sp.]|uniref:hypothetical protein n=1 Tax=Methylocystis sp. TaxID=1911079 RepID=UPI0027338290|nr:hypothetical protein [Methylocystis sp.]MDP3553088.1 hypothetical protein [Methylocystis sp.]